MFNDIYRWFNFVEEEEGFHGQIKWIEIISPFMDFLIVELQKRQSHRTLLIKSLIWRVDSFLPKLNEYLLAFSIWNISSTFYIQKE